MPGLRTALVDAWYQGSRWLWLLRPLEYLFVALVALRRLAYRRGVLSSYSADRPVVIVGSITVGGSGKTPVVIALLEALEARGLSVGVVSRGYGSRGTGAAHVVSASSTVEDCGDEPLLIFQRTACPLVVAASRAEAVKTLLEQFDVDLVISDDGLQHYALSRDLEVLVLDARARCGNGFCLPAGPLREPRHRLREVDFVLYRGSDDEENGVRYQQLCLVHLSTGEERPLAPRSASEHIYAVSGIGHPGQFYDSLEKLGYVLTRCSFPDHHPFSRRDFSGMADHPIIMTEKDAVKCRSFGIENAWYVKIAAHLPETLTSAAVALVRH